MPRYTPLVLAFLVAATSAAGLDLGEIKAKGVLRVIAAADEAPETFSFAGGENPGIDRELVEGFARLHGLRVEPVKAKTYVTGSRASRAARVTSSLRSSTPRTVGSSWISRWRSCRRTTWP